MFCIAKPTEHQIRATLARQQLSNFSYPEVGLTQEKLPTGYLVLRDRATLGRGSTDFERAKKALGQWKMFDLSGVWLCWPSVPILPGNVVGVLIKHFGFWSLSCCRIVYIVDDRGGPTERYGFAYGTLPEHAERGEELFTVEWDRVSDVVSYNILSFSRPGGWQTRIAYPVARWLEESARMSHRTDQLSAGANTTRTTSSSAMS
jgi:uncharacterized protein (UPF0548 family)